ncbi:MAG TPA: hypothetical protein PLZ51_11925, partial [Aggregatilineales bacterium]|nr:hypothetical protein [Aggregatilineales bacterium]
MDKHVLPLGAVLGIFNLVDCIPTEEIRPHLSPLELALGDYSNGRYAWRLQPVKIFAEPIVTSGKQGL